MSKITKLTAEQEALIPVWRERFRSEALRTDTIDEAKARESVIALYNSVDLPSPRLVLFAQSPMQAQLMRSFLSLDKGAQLRAQLGDQLGTQLGTQLWDQLWDQLRDQLWDQLWDQLGTQLRAQLGDQLRTQLRDQLWDQLRDQLWAQLGAQLGTQLWDQLWDQLKKFDGLAFGAGLDGHWLAYYSFGRHVGCELTDRQNAWLDAYLTYSRECGVAFLYSDVAIVSDRPRYIGFDEELRLHGEGRAALEWSDGYTVCAHHGVRVPDQWILSPDTVTPEDVLRVESTEQRAAGIGILGMAHMLDKLQHEVIDSDPDPQKGELLRVWLDGLPDPGIYLKAECPRNGTIVEAVPPVCEITNNQIKTVKHAQAWRVGLAPTEFHYPSLRT
jgi:hypothetical protein